MAPGRCLLPLPALHGAHPLPGCQHLVQRLPAAGGHPGPGRLHAPPVRVPRRSPGLQPGHRRPRRRGRLAGRRLPGRDAPAHPALRRRRVRRLHHQPGRHGPPLADRASQRLHVSAGHQRHRLRRDGDRGRGRDGGQGADLAHRHHPHPLPRGPDALHPPRVPGDVPPARAAARPGHRAPAPTRARHRARAQHLATGRPGRQLRSLHRRRRACRPRDRRRGRGDRHARGVGAPDPGRAR